MNNTLTKRYVKNCQHLMVVCRQAIEGGYCLIVEDDFPTAKIIEKVIRGNGIESRIVDSAEDALTILHEDSEHVISVVVDHKLVGNGNGEEVVQDLERNYKGVPYVFHTGDSKAAKEIAEKYPNANVIMKGESMFDLVNSLGFSV